MNIALPSIQDELAVTPTHLPWTVNAGWRDDAQVLPGDMTGPHPPQRALVLAVLADGHQLPTLFVVDGPARVMEPLTCDDRADRPDHSEPVDGLVDWLVDGLVDPMEADMTTGRPARLAPEREHPPAEPAGRSRP